VRPRHLRRAARTGNEESLVALRKKVSGGD
jgi:hypothetical protein